MYGDYVGGQIETSFVCLLCGNQSETAFNRSVYRVRAVKANSSTHTLVPSPTAGVEPVLR